MASAYLPAAIADWKQQLVAGDFNDGIAGHAFSRSRSDAGNTGEAFGVPATVEGVMPKVFPRGNRGE